MRKSISLLLMLVFALFVACGKGKTGDGKTNGGSSGGSASAGSENPHKLDKEFFKTYYNELGKILKENAADADKAGELAVKWIEDHQEKVDALKKYLAWFDTKEWMDWGKKNAGLLLSTGNFASGMMELGKQSPKYMQSKNFQKFLQMQARPGLGKK